MRILVRSAPDRGARSCLHCAVASERLAALAAALTQIAQQLLALGTRFLLPLPAQFGAPRVRQALVFAEIGRMRSCSSGGQILEIAPALTDQCAALFGQVAPAAEAIACARASSSFICSQRAAPRDSAN